MDLSSSELKNVALVGALAAAGGVLYQLGSTFLQQSTDQVALDPPAEAIHLNPQLLNAFVQLAEFRSYNPAAYRQAVIQADSLMLRSHGIVNKDILPCIDDLSDAIAFKITVLKQLQLMSDSALRQHNNPRAAAQIERLKDRIYPELESCHRVIQQSLR